MGHAVSSEVKRSSVVPAGIEPDCMRNYHLIERKGARASFDRGSDIALALTDKGGIAHAQSFARLPRVAASRSITLVSEDVMSVFIAPTHII